jgi:vacuolar-type H+-ATPase subunit F/Vma7
MVRYSSGQRGQTVNLLRKLRRFESFSHHKKIGIIIIPNDDLEKIIARVAQLVELQPSKLTVAGSSPVSRSIFLAGVAQG